jgi:hypothetical protein
MKKYSIQYVLNDKAAIATIQADTDLCLGEGISFFYKGNQISGKVENVDKYISPSGEVITVLFLIGVQLIGGNTPVDPDSLRADLAYAE